jgi:hypothetical protein
MAVCLPQLNAKELLRSLREGKIIPERLMEMSSEERRTFFSNIVGENAKDVNALFESKLLLKDQKRGLVTWAKQLTGIKESIRTDLLSKIERLNIILDAKDQKAFYEDLASKRLNADVTFEEAKKIVDGTKEISAAKDAIPDNSPVASKERLNYGIKFVLFQDYIKELKGKGKFMPFKEWIKSPSAMYNTISGSTKSILSALDNSFFGRQGIKVLYTKPTIWMSAFLKSWRDIGKELAGKDAMIPIKADTYSRPNALNGNYARMRLDVGITGEEAFPSALPEKIPLLGKLFKASESAFNGAAIRMRADLADKLITVAEKQGIDFTDKIQARGVGDMINSLTGRGRINLTEGQGSFVNNTFFSIKFLKGNFDILTMHRLGFGIEKGSARSFVRKQAALNLAKIVGITAAIFYTAEKLNPGSTTKNPGFITVGKTRFDITGGLSSIAMLGYKMYTKTMNQLEHKTKYGQQTALDVFEQFFEGKLSPVAGVIRDFWRGQTFQGTKPTIGNELQNIITPLPIQTFQDLQNPNAAPMFGSMILDGLGISTYTPPKK